MNIHPSLFETLDNITNDISASPLVGESIDTLVSPGTYNLTSQGQTLKVSNSSVLKNIQEDTLLTQLFFSNENINAIQKLLRLVIYKKMGQVIDSQSNNEVLTIMRSIFLEYSRHPEMVPTGENVDPQLKKTILEQYTKECDRLNRIVVNEIVPIIATALKQYVTYIDESTRLPIELPRPIATSIAGTRQLRSTTNVLTGGD